MALALPPSRSSPSTPSSWRRGGSRSSHSSAPLLAPAASVSLPRSCGGVGGGGRPGGRGGGGGWGGLWGLLVKSENSNREENRQRRREGWELKVYTSNDNKMQSLRRKPQLWHMLEMESVNTLHTDGYTLPPLNSRKESSIDCIRTHWNILNHVYMETELTVYIKAIVNTLNECITLRHISGWMCATETQLWMRKLSRQMCTEVNLSDDVSLLFFCIIRISFLFLTFPHCFA